MSFRRKLTTTLELESPYKHSEKMLGDVQPWSRSGSEPLGAEGLYILRIREEKDELFFCSPPSYAYTPWN